jgi:DNA topoisomerase-1
VPSSIPAPAQLIARLHDDPEECARRAKLRYVSPNEPGLTRLTIDTDHVPAAMLRVIDVTGLRVGNEVCAEEKESYGLTTLTKRHVRVQGATVDFRFPAKSGKRAEVSLVDAGVARVVDHTATALRYLRAQLPAGEDAETVVVAAIDAVSEALGNTRAVAQAHYVHPVVVDGYTSGELARFLAGRRVRGNKYLDGDERLLLAFLSDSLERRAADFVAA